MKQRYYFLNGKGGGQSFKGFPLTMGFFNPDVPLEEERYQAEFWKRMQRESEKRSRKLFSEWMSEARPAKSKDEITPEMIERAKEFPIESLIEVKNKVAQCISGEHSDKRPSMSVKNNRVRCFSCGWSGDPIDVAMKLWGLSFPDAIRRLQ